MPSEAPNSDCPDPDEVLAECLRAPQAAQRARLDAACALHPALESELREQFAILHGLGLADLASAAPSTDAPRHRQGRFGDFDLGDVIAEGGMGVVYQARQMNLDREVALKLIRPELLHFESTRKRFAREAEAVARLQHPGIVPIYAFGEEQGVPYLAMELVEGQSLEALLRTRAESGSARGAPWVREVLGLGVQIASALHHAHARGIIHRDVKPSNVLIDGSGRASLIDFGLHGLGEDEGVEERLTREGSAPGTLLYMAPEQLETGAYDVRSEVYSLGATLFELLTHRPPFRGETRSSTEQLIRRGQVASLRRFQPSVTKDVDAVVRKALSLDPTRRYVDCAAFENDLRHALERRPVTARPDGALYRLRCWARRQPALAGVSVVALVLAVAAPAAIMVQQKAHSDDLMGAFEEEREARLAAEDLSDFVIDVLESADPNVAKPTPAVEQILERSVARLDGRLSRWPERRADVLRVLGRIHGSLGLYARGRELLAEAVETMEASLAALESEGGSSSRERTSVMARLVEARSAYAQVLYLQGDRVEAYRQRGLLAEEMAEQWPEGHWRRLHAKANWMRLASGLPDTAFEESPAPTKDEVRAAFRATARALEATEDASPEIIAATQGWLGTMLLQEAQPLSKEERAPLLAESRAAMEASLAAFERSKDAGTLDEANARNGYGLVLKYLGDLEGCEAQYRRVLEIFEERLKPDNPNIAVVGLNMAGLLEARGERKEAIVLLEQARNIFEATFPRTHPNFVHVIGNLAGTRYRAGDHEGLIELYDEVIELQIQTYPESHPFPPASYEQRGLLRLAAGDKDGAKEDLTEALRRYRVSQAEDSAPVVRLRKALEEL